MNVHLKQSVILEFKLKYIFDVEMPVVMCTYREIGVKASSIIKHSESKVVIYISYHPRLKTALICLAVFRCKHNFVITVSRLFLFHTSMRKGSYNYKGEI